MLIAVIGVVKSLYFRKMYLLGSHASRPINLSNTTTMWNYTNGKKTYKNVPIPSKEANKSKIKYFVKYWR